MAYLYGVAVFTATGVSGAILNDFNIVAAADSKELAGNPASEIEEVRVGKTSDKITASFVTSTHVDPVSLIGDSVTITIQSEDGVSAEVNKVGTCTNAELRGSKEDWWIYSITVDVPTAT